MNPRITFIRAFVLALLLAAPLVGAAGARAHAGGRHLNQGEAASRTFDSLSLLRRASTSTQTAATSCSPEARAEQLADTQRQVLGRLGKEQPLDDPTTPDLTTLRNEADLAALAALGYSVYAHQQASFEDRGWGVGDAVGPPEDPIEVKPVAGRPSVLLYTPSGQSVTEPRDGWDFPYHFAGWWYVFAFVPYTFGQHPIVGGDGQPFLRCLERKEWFVHERGLHPFEDAGMVPLPPLEEVHGTAPGDSGPPPEAPGDIPHRRMWDLHMWLVEGSAVPIVQQASPYPIPGKDVSQFGGVSPPPNWPRGPYPASYYPPRAADLSLTLADSPDPVHVGARLTYTIVVANHGPDKATGTSVTVELPRQADSGAATPSQGSCTAGKTQVTCNLGELAVGSSALVRVVVRPIRKGVATSSASVTARELDLKEKADATQGWGDGTADNTAPASTTVLP
jgi:uncharacterized repeat protein (TIGR01451 family)